MRLPSFVSLLVAASCAGTPPLVSVPAPAPAYPPSLGQLGADGRAKLAAELRANSPFQLDLVRASSFGDIHIDATDPALVEQRLDHGGFTPDEIARLERLVVANAAIFHVHDVAHAKLAPTDAGARELALREVTADGVAQINVSRSWYSSSDRKVHAIVFARFRRSAPALPDATTAEAALLARLVGSEYDRVTRFHARPCDPVGQRDTCPRSHDETTRVTIDSSQVIVATGAIELVRDPGMPLETRVVACATIATRTPPPPTFGASFAFGGERYVPVNGAPPLPVVIDLVTDEDLTAQLHRHGGIGCNADGVRGAGYDTSEFVDY